MPLKKQYLKSRPEVRVTFEINKQATHNAKKVYLLGEFNDWTPVELEHLKNGKFKTVISLPTDQQPSYQFRYKFCGMDGEETFDNDWNADAYQPNSYGEDNSVVMVSY
ncbi:isoamylase early set domain-containing protein [Celerinatantimonas yamalensis]|uniref:Isoamylase early set domain-containing protein n=1 Tax=Celerinatantimonas yamalensis TaxID=559956 RepID=A0ABW9GAU4_9GAMM